MDPKEIESILELLGKIKLTGKYALAIARAIEALVAILEELKKEAASAAQTPEVLPPENAS